MPTFGKYEADRMLAETPHGALFSGTRRDRKSGERVAIKAFYAGRSVWEARNREEQIADFLTCAATQQRVSDHSPHWAVVLDYGTTPDGGYYVTQLYPRSAAQLVSQRVELTSVQLQAIVQSVVRGLIDLRDRLRRQHGNLRPGNILIARPKSFGPQDVVLTDPAPPDRTGQANDLAALGETIYELVMHRPREARYWPVPQSPEWDRLGRSGDGWRELTNALLHPKAAPGMRTLEAVLQRTGPLATRTVGGGRTGRIVAAVVTLGAIGAAAYASRDEIGNWVRNARESTAVALSEDDAPVTTQDRPPAADPAERDVPPPPIDVPIDEPRPASEPVAPAEPELTPAPPSPVEPDPAPDVIAQAPGIQPTDRIAPLPPPDAQPAEPPAEQASPAETARLERLAGLFRSLAPLEESQDRLLAKFPRFVEARASAGDVSDAELSQWEELGRQMVEASNDARVDWDALRDQGTPVPTVATLEAFNARLAEIPRFRRPDAPDPRQAEANAELFRKARVIEKEGQSTQEGQRVAEILTGLELYRWVEKDRLAVAKGVDKLRAAVAAQEDSVIADLRAIPASAAALAALPEQSAIRAAWAERRDWLLGELRTAGMRDLTLRAALDGLASSFDVLAQGYGVTPLDAPVAATQAAEGNVADAPAVEAVIDQAVARRRSEGLKAALDGVPPSGPQMIQAVTSDQARRHFAESVETNKAWASAAEELKQRLAQLNAHLAKPADAQALTAALSEAAKAVEALKDAEVAEAAGAMLERADNLIAAQTSTDENRLVALAGSDDRALAVAAWRRLGQLPGGAWPSSADELKAELRLSRQLAQVEPELAGEIKAQRTERWAKFLEDQWTPEQQDVLQWFTTNVSFGTIAADELPAWFRYNVLLAAAKADPDQQLEPLVDYVQALPADFVNQRPAVRTLSEQFERLRAATDANAPAAGPASVPGQLFLKTSFGEALFTGPGRQEYDFVRVQPKDPNLAPFYLGTTEVTVGMFAAAVQALRAGGPVAGLLPEPEASPHGWRFAGDGVVVPHENWGNVVRGVPPPTGDHPMQQVTPQAALLFARLVGCRLPTPAEWQAALDAARADERAHPWAMKGWKLRDAFWRNARVEDYAQLTAGAFLPPGAKPGAADPSPDATWPETELARLGGESAVQSRARGGARHLTESVDVLFRPTKASGRTRYPRGQGLYDLVGNVAEFVVNDPAGMSETLGAAPDDVKTFLDRNADAVAVVGGSALSPPSLDLTAPHPVGPDRVRKNSAAFSDVGFRLVFTDPTATDLAARRAAVLVANADYLPAPRANAAAAPTTSPAAAAAAAVGPGSR